ncbi:Uncharacterised protein [Streptococcus pneumoniae]|nr:Uncharacterised protein [Streptococcus pneumoniae]
MTISYAAHASYASSFIHFEERSSAGFGGIGPLVSTSRCFSFDACTACSIELFFNKTDVKPTIFSRKKAVCTVGFRKSASIRSTFFPCWANTTARLAAVVDFPSPGQADVIITDFIWRSTEANSIFVRIVRYCSEFKDFGSVIAMTFLRIRESLLFLSAKMSTPRFFRLETL